MVADSMSAATLFYRGGVVNREISLSEWTPCFLKIRELIKKAKALQEPELAKSPASINARMFTRSNQSLIAESNEPQDDQESSVAPRVGDLLEMALESGVLPDVVSVLNALVKDSRLAAVDLEQAAQLAKMLQPFDTIAPKPKG